MFPPPWQDPNTFQMPDVDGPDAVARKRLRGKPYRSLLQQPPNLRKATSRAPILQISQRLNERLEEEEIGHSSMNFGLRLSSALSQRDSVKSVQPFRRATTVDASIGRTTGISIVSNDLGKTVQNQIMKSATLSIPSPHRAGPPVFTPKSQEIFRDMWSTLESTRPQQFWMSYREEQDRRSTTARHESNKSNALPDIRRPKKTLIKPVSLAMDGEIDVNDKIDEKYQAGTVPANIFQSVQAYGKASPNLLLNARNKRVADALLKLNAEKDEDQGDIVSLPGE